MNTRKRWLTSARIALAATLLTFAGSAAYAFQGDIKDALEEDGDRDFPGLVDEGEYLSPQYDVEITWTDDWAVGDETDPNVEHAIGGNYDGAVASDPNLGDIVFLVDTESETSVLSLGFSPNEAPADPELLEGIMGQSSFLEDNLFLSNEAEVVMLDSNRDTVAIVAREAAPNDDHVVYMLIVSDPGREDYGFWVGLDMYEPDEYERILTSMADDIEVEDNDIFGVFGADEILESLDAGADVPTEEPVETEEPTEEPVETEEPTEEPVETEAPTEQPVETEEPTEQPVETEKPTEEPTEEPAEAATEVPDGTPPPFEPATEEPVASPEASPEGAGELPGLIGEGDYLSPQHDVPVTWTETWILDPGEEPPVQSFLETEIDALLLTDARSESAIVYITIESGDSPFEGPDILEALSNPEYIESVLRLSPDSEVVLTDSTQDAAGAVYVDSSGDSPFVSVLEVRAIDDDTYVFVELRADASGIDAALLDAVAGEIEVDGEAGFGIFSTDRVLDALP